jgi:hypothetical protein
MAEYSVQGEHVGMYYKAVVIGGDTQTWAGSMQELAWESPIESRYK